MQGSKQKTILVVEDHPRSREILVLQLGRMGYDVVEAEDGEAAMNKALAESPDLTIMDLWLPRMNGFQVTTKMKGNSQTAHIPVIAYTAAEHKDYKAIALQVGMAEFLLKPAPAHILEDLIDKFLKDKP